ncbi:SRPBCC family protein [Mycobacteroides abscessus]|uniref:SRPBCC family protein n=1 Tax=Mycobacteroides abscessus TaxID=36809 RepID=UPI000C26BA25|nr:SRPBCC domain-containing protein [Mycobacteroides abscessus]
MKGNPTNLESAVPDDANDIATIILDQFYRHPPERVWAVMVCPDAMEEWLMDPVGFRPEVGTRFRFIAFPIPVADFSGALSCEVLAATPSRVLSIRWWDMKSAKQREWTVTWTLQEVPGGTMVTLRHEGFDPSDPASRVYRTLSERGWPGTMGRLGRCIASAPAGDDQPPHCLVTDVSA